MRFWNHIDWRQINQDEAGYVAIVTAMVSVVVAAGLIQITASNTKHKIQQSTLEEAITNTAQMQNSWANALEGYIEANQEGWSSGHTESVSTADLQPDHLVNGFGDNGKTPFGQTFVASVKKPGDTVQAVVFQQGSMDPQLFRDVGMKKTSQTVRSVAYRIQQTYLNNFATSKRVPAVLPAGSTTADGGDLFSVNISDFVGSAPSRARVVMLKNFPGLIDSTSADVLGELDGETVTLVKEATYSASSTSLPWRFIEERGKDNPDNVVITNLTITAVGGGGGKQWYSKYSPSPTYTGCSKEDGRNGSSTIVDGYLSASGGQGYSNSGGYTGVGYDNGHSGGGDGGDGGSSCSTDDDFKHYNGGRQGYAGQVKTKTWSNPSIPSNYEFTGSIGSGGKGGGENGYVKIDITWKEQTTTSYRVKTQ